MGADNTFGEENFITIDSQPIEVWTKTNNIRIYIDKTLRTSRLQQMQKNNLGNEKWVDVEVIEQY